MRRSVSHIALSMLFAAAQTASICSILQTPVFSAILFSVVFAGLLAAVAAAVGSVLKYSNIEQYPAVQRMVNYAALGALFVIIPLGLSLGAVCLFFNTEIFSQFLVLAPFECIVALLLYFVVFYYFKNKILLSNKTEEPEPSSEPVRELVERRETIDQITVKTGQKLLMVNVQDIFYLQSDGDYVQIHTADKKLLKEQTMKYYEESLPQSLFVRTHRSYIVNIRKIARIELYEKQTQLLTLTNGEQLRVSPAGYKLLRIRLGL